MSLIIDAIQKAQQLRPNEARAAPLFRKDVFPKRGCGGPWKWIWVAGGAVTGISALLLLLATHTVPLFAHHQKEKVSPVAVKIEEKQETFEELPGKEIIPPSPSQDPVSAIGLTDEKIRAEFPKQPPARKKRTDADLQSGEAAQKGPSKKKIKAEREMTSAWSAVLPGKVAPEKGSPAERKKEKEQGQATDTLAHFNLGVSFYHQGQVLKAIDAYRKAIEIDPDYVEAHNNLGVIYQDIGDFDKALAAYRKSIEVNPEYEKGYHNLGTLLYLRGDHGAAIEAFEKALALNRNNIESYINLGILFKRQGQTEKAIDCYRKALQINPLHGEAHYNIGLLHEELDHFELAINHYQQFTRLGSRSHPDLVSRVQRHLNYLMMHKGSRVRGGQGPSEIANRKHPDF